jgi:hypothetical protein
LQPKSIQAATYFHPDRQSPLTDELREENEVREELVDLVDPEVEVEAIQVVKEAVELS